MKIMLFVLCLLSTTVAFAQYGNTGSARSSEPFIVESPSHPMHAGYASMATGQSILASASYSAAQGDRPASDFPQPEAMALGTAARELRKQHEHMRKSRVVWVNQ
jgi:hypothetical protein